MKQKRPPFSDLEFARSAGKKGGTTKAKRKLTLERVQKELPPMDSPESIVTRLERISQWAASGLLSGTTTHALVRAAEIGLKAHESAMSREIVTKLKERLAELEQQVQKRNVRAVR